MAGRKLFGSFFLSIIFIAGTIILVSNASPTVSSSSSSPSASASPSFPWPLPLVPEPLKIISPSPAPFPSPFPYTPLPALAPPSPSLGHPPLMTTLPLPPPPASAPPSPSQGPPPLLPPSPSPAPAPLSRSPSPTPTPIPPSPSPAPAPLSRSPSPTPTPIPPSPLPAPAPLSRSPSPTPAPIPPSPSPAPAPLSRSPSPTPAPIPPSPSPAPAPLSSPPSPAPAPQSRGIKGGYWPSWLAETSPPSTIPTSYFTHLFYAFVLPDATSYQLSITQPDHQWMQNFTATLHAKTPRAKAILSIGRATSSSFTFSNLASNHDNRAGFINSTITIARKYNFDGLDLDWEFPNTPQDMSSLSILFSEWHTAIVKEASATGKPRLLLSAAVYFSSIFFLSETPRTYPGDAIKHYVDFVNPMCYDYHGAWDTSVTGAQALLYDKSSNLSTSYGISSWIRNGVPAKKLVMGLPMYGRTWQLKDPNEHGIGAPAVGIGPGNDGLMIYSDIVDFNLANNASVVYDEETVSTYSYAGTNWIGYDGPTSIANKVKFAKTQGLGGYFFWAFGFDKNWTLSRAASLAWDGKI